MTTKDSSLADLKAQADRIARTLKAAERGEQIDARFAARFTAARGRDTFNFGVVMDDKVLVIEMPWVKIRETDEAGLSEFIVRKMQEKSDVH